MSVVYRRYTRVYNKLSLRELKLTENLTKGVDKMHHNLSITLNIRYDQSKELWIRLEEVYCNMEGWQGYKNNIPYWFGDESCEHIEASVEPGGLQIYGNIDEVTWNRWIEELVLRCSEALGYQIGEPEEGFSFPNY